MHGEMKNDDYEWHVCQSWMHDCNACTQIHVKSHITRASSQLHYIHNQHKKGLQSVVILSKTGDIFVSGRHVLKMSQTSVTKHTVEKQTDEKLSMLP